MNNSEVNISIDAVLFESLNKLVQKNNPDLDSIPKVIQMLLDVSPPSSELLQQKLNKIEGILTRFIRNMVPAAAMIENIYELHKDSELKITQSWPDAGRLAVKSIRSYYHDK